jgi:hypothetical protein
MAKAVTLTNGRTWATRTAAIDHFTEMLSRYKHKEVLQPGADHEDLLALLYYYDRTLDPNASTKVGAGVAYFAKGLAHGEGFTSACFHVHRLDGSFDDFSFIKAIRS